MAMGSTAAEYAMQMASGELEPGSLEKYIDSGTVTVTIDSAEEAMAKAF
jgi:hypothetical protein